ncbi:hypothetical protein MKX03_031366 [Papaver bracteatum]|nr:hypothetical protein MKX03_031366 [Papaver bracteatum]
MILEDDRMKDRIGGKDHETLTPRVSWILYLTLSASIGGLIFGYYVGFIILRLGVLSDLDSILQETVRTGLVGAILGAAAGGWTNDCWGRKFSILLADTMILIGGVSHMLLLSNDNKYSWETIGNVFIALGVGMASMTSPLYISEISPPKLRDIFVSINFILYGIEEFTFLYLCIYTIRTTKYIIALVGIPALFQFYLMFSNSEPPTWLYKKDREDDAIKALKNLYTCCDVEKEFDAFKLSLRRQTANEDEISYSGGSSISSNIRSAWSSPSVRKQFVVGTALQVAKQLMGLNALIFCVLSIRRMSGLEVSYPKTDIWIMSDTLLGSHGITSIFGGFCCTVCLLAGFGKRKILRWSIYGILGSALALSFIFVVSPNTTEVVSRSQSTIHFNNNTCLSYITSLDWDSWDCLTCLQASSGCGFCRGIHYNFLGQSSGACLMAEANGTSQACTDENRSWSTKYCEYNIFKGTILVLMILVFYSLFGSAGLEILPGVDYGETFDPVIKPCTIACSLFGSAGLEILPWIINSQMYPTEVRGIYGGTAAAANWIFFLIIIISSFLITKTGGPLFMFLLINLFSFFASWLIELFVPDNICSRKNNC